MRGDLPSGTVTFLFTDVEGSTRLLHELGAAGYAGALAEHRRVLRAAFTAQGGVEVDTQGDAFFVAFPTAPGALQAAADARAGLQGGPITVRIGLHTGTPLLTDEGYVGHDVHRAARIAACGHGGQVLVSASTSQLVDGGRLRDLGEHRLKDLSAPERIYQLGDDAFPPLKSLYRTNLPIPATPFLGRERELGEVLGLLTRDDVRLLTLTGPGGTGKTRLALQAAAAASDAYPDGVFWVPLAPLRDPQLVLRSAAEVVGADDALAEHLADRQLLLLFDNFEHLLGAAHDVATLLSACPNLRVLITSRERLRVQGEQTWPVPPLDERDGTVLFTARARAIDPSFTAGPAVKELCTRLDELPLAIELAAARTALFSPEQLLERIAQRLDLLRGDRDADPRQQTLRATIEWSHDLLAEDERKLFRRLSVFAGGCSFEAAERVAAADPDTLQSLLDKSLVRKRDDGNGRPRYWMLETIHEYASDRLEAAGETGECLDRHATYFMSLAESADPFLQRDTERGRGLAGLAVENDNFRAALDRLGAGDDTFGALRMTAALRDFWLQNALVVEGRQRLEEALANDDSAPSAVRIEALNGLATLASEAGALESARCNAEQALALSRALENDRCIAESLWNLGYILGELGDRRAALPLVEEAVRLFRQLGELHFAAQANRTVGFILLGLGELERGQALHEENLRWARSAGDRTVESLSLSSLAMAIVGQGQPIQALQLLAEAYPIHVALGNRSQLLTHLCRFALAYAYAGDTTRSVRLLAAAAALREQTGYRIRWVDELNEMSTAIARSSLDDGAFDDAWNQGSHMTLEAAFALALDGCEDGAAGLRNGGPAAR